MFGFITWGRGINSHGSDAGPDVLRWKGFLTSNDTGPITISLLPASALIVDLYPPQPSVTLAYGGAESMTSPFRETGVVRGLWVCQHYPHTLALGCVPSAAGTGCWGVGQVEWSGRDSRVWELSGCFCGQETLTSRLADSLFLLLLCLTYTIYWLHRRIFSYNCVFIHTMFPEHKEALCGICYA